MKITLEEKTDAIEKTFNNTGISLLSISNAVSKNKKIIDLLQTNQDEELRETLKDLYIDINKINPTIHTLEITDVNGIILARGGIILQNMVIINQVLLQNLYKINNHI